MKSTLYYLIIICALLSCSCHEKSSETAHSKERNPTDVEIDCYTEDCYTEDWKPFDVLKVKNLNSCQISQIYGQPIFTGADTLRWGKNDYFDDEEYLPEQIKKSPLTIIHTFIWTVDSTRVLKLYCVERTKGVYTPVYGYQCSYRIMSLE